MPLDQAHALQDGQTLRETARALRIHLSTAHRWRHRFLAVPKTVQPQILTGIAEADETMFLLSFKGKRNGLDRKVRKRGGKDTQRVYHNRLKAWVQKPRGVATCYLANYLGWFRALDREKSNGPKPQQWLASNSFNSTIHYGRHQRVWFVISMKAEIQTH